MDIKVPASINTRLMESFIILWAKVRNWQSEDMDKHGRLCPIISTPSPSPTKMKAKRRYKPAKTKKKGERATPDTKDQQYMKNGELSAVLAEWIMMPTEGKAKKKQASLHPKIVRRLRNWRHQ